VSIWQRFLRWKNDSAYWEQSAATKQLQNAWSRVWYSRWNTASARERKCLLPEDDEVLDILHKLAGESLDRQRTLL